MLVGGVICVFHNASRYTNSLNRKELQPESFIFIFIAPQKKKNFFSKFIFISRKFNYTIK